MKLFSILLVGGMIALSSCGPPVRFPTRDVVRGTVLLALDADRIGTGLCHDATVAREAKSDLVGARDLARGCEAAHDAVVAGAVAMREALEVWDDAAVGKAWCAAARMGRAIGVLAKSMPAGVTVPAGIEDATAGLAALGGLCR